MFSTFHTGNDCGNQNLCRALLGWETLISIKYSLKMPFSHMKNKMFSAILSVTDISDQTERILLTLMLNLNYTNTESLQNAKIDERGLYHLLPILQASFIRVYHVIISD